MTMNACCMWMGDGGLCTMPKEGAGGIEDEEEETDRDEQENQNQDHSSGHRHKMHGCSCSLCWPCKGARFRWCKQL